jgi:hypothetical protein
VGRKVTARTYGRSRTDTVLAKAQRGDRIMVTFPTGHAYKEWSAECAIDHDVVGELRSPYNGRYHAWIEKV